MPFTARQRPIFSFDRRAPLFTVIERAGRRSRLILTAHHKNPVAALFVCDAGHICLLAFTAYVYRLDLKTRLLRRAVNRLYSL